MDYLATWGSRSVQENLLKSSALSATEMRDCKFVACVASAKLFLIEPRKQNQQKGETEAKRKGDKEEVVRHMCVFKARP